MQNYSDISKNEQRFFVPFQLTQKLINYCKNILKVYGMTLWNMSFIPHVFDINALSLFLIPIPQW